jgi:hypothetical protein
MLINAIYVLKPILKMILVSVNNAIIVAILVKELRIQNALIVL